MQCGIKALNFTGIKHVHGGLALHCNCVQNTSTWNYGTVEKYFPKKCCDLYHGIIKSVCISFGKSSRSRARVAWKLYILFHMMESWQNIPLKYCLIVICIIVVPIWFFFFVVPICIFIVCNIFGNTEKIKSVWWPFLIFDWHLCYPLSWFETFHSAPFCKKMGVPRRTAVEKFWQRI